MRVEFKINNEIYDKIKKPYTEMANSILADVHSIYYEVLEISEIKIKNSERIKVFLGYKDTGSLASYVISKYDYDENIFTPLFYLEELNQYIKSLIREEKLNKLNEENNNN